MDAKYLKILLSYEPETGKLLWLQRPVEMFQHKRAWKAWNTRYAGKEAFTASQSSGYKSGSVFGRAYLAHRVIWAIVHDEWPEDQIDHINGIRDDNKIANLRAVTNIENQKNAKRQRNNTSGVVGVLWNKRDRVWRAQIRVSGVSRHLGSFKNKDDAIAARADAEHVFGFHKNHGRAN